MFPSHTCKLYQHALILGVNIYIFNVPSVNIPPRFTIYFYYTSKPPRYEANDNIIFQYSEILGVGLTHNSKNRAVDKIRHNNEDYDVRFAKIYLS